MPTTSGCPWLTDEQDMPPDLDQALRLAVDLTDQWAGGVEIIEPSRLRRGRHYLGHAVGAEHHRPAVGHFVELVDEHRAHAAKPVDDELVVDDLVPDIDRRTVQLDRLFDDRDCPVNSGAKAARRGNQDMKGGKHDAHVSDCLQAAKALPMTAAIELPVPGACVE